MFDVIVVGTDGSESAGVAVEHAADLALMKGGILHIVSAYRPVSLGSVAMAASAGASPIDVDQVNRGVAAEGELVCEHAAEAARRRGVKVEVHAVPGEPADVLIGVAQEVGADVLVVGNRGMSGARRFVLGSVPNKVSHHCPCSLLIVDTSTT
ncbi:MAG TPA: universal stress protein [Acidimicrobiia bacterium]|nr:universal stress protein [Acidimicrobiia bacterium]